MKTWIFGISILVMIFLCVGIILFQISKSRTTQVFGEIYSRIETNQKVVALTFDDGPTHGKTEKILQILREENIKATFYLIGNDIEKNLGETEKIIAEGHEIGNHSYSHQRMILVTPSFVQHEIEKTDELIKKAGYKDEITFRPPYGKKLLTLPYYLSNKNRKTITWDVEPETFVENSDNIINYVVENTKSGSIILLHVMYKSRTESMKAVRPIIKNLKKKGYEFRTVSELISMNS